MTLAYPDRISTEDVDVWMDRGDVLKLAATEVSEQLGLPGSWLNNAVTDFLPNTAHKWDQWQDLSHLTVLVAKPTVMLAMKLDAGRLKDLPDIRRLMDTCGLGNDSARAFQLHRTLYGRELSLEKRLLITDYLKEDG